MAHRGGRSGVDDPGAGCDHRPHRGAVLCPHSGSERAGGTVPGPPGRRTRCGSPHHRIGQPIQHDIEAVVQHPHRVVDRSTGHAGCRRVAVLVNGCRHDGHRTPLSREHSGSHWGRDRRFGSASSVLCRLDRRSADMATRGRLIQTLGDAVRQQDRAHGVDDELVRQGRSGEGANAHGPHRAAGVRHDRQLEQATPWQTARRGPGEGQEPSVANQDTGAAVA